MPPRMKCEDQKVRDGAARSWLERLTHTSAAGADTGKQRDTEARFVPQQIEAGLDFK